MKRPDSVHPIIRVIGPFLLILGILCCEVFLWLVKFPHWRQAGALLTQPIFHMPDKDLGWKNKPGNYHLSDGKREIRLNINPDSTRRSSNTYISENPSVILIGDSFMQGYGLNDEDTLGWLIQENLVDLHIKNYGTGGYGTYQSLLSLKQLISYSTQIKTEKIIYLFNEFHEERNTGSPNWQLLIVPPPFGADFHFPYVEISDIDQNKLIQVRSTGLSPWKISTYSRTSALLNLVYWQIEAMHRLSKKDYVTRLIIKEMVETANLLKAQLNIVFFNFDITNQNKYTESISDPSLRWIDCNLPEQDDYEFRLDDGHPNEAMNRILARCILNKI